MSLHQWFYPPQFKQEIQTRLARNLYLILTSVFSFEVVFGLLIFAIFPNNPLPALGFLGIAMLFTIGCYILMQRGNLNLASLIFCFLLGLTTLGASIRSNGGDSLTIQTYSIVIMIAGLLLSTRYSLFFAVMGILSVIGIHLAENSEIITITRIEYPALLKVAISSFVFLMTSILLATVSRTTSLALQRAKQNETALEEANNELKAIQANLEQRIEHRTAQLQASVEISQTISNLLDSDQLGQRVIQKLVSLFPFEFATIYLVENSEKWAILSYTNQTHPQTPVSETQQIDLTKPNSVADAIRTRKTKVTTPSSLNLAHLAPQIHVEITLPLLSRGKPLGAIQLQSTHPQTISQREILTLESVANQIATAFETARLFNESQQQLREINRLNQFYLQTTWQALLTQDVPAYHLSRGTVAESPHPNETALTIAQNERKIHIEHDNMGNATLIAPIMFQDQVLGAIELVSTQRIWTNDEIVLIEAILNQTALSLENTRLILETQTRAEQEKMISDISSRVRETLDLETILQTSVQEMQKKLKLSEVEIRLLPPTLHDTAELHFSPSDSGA